MKKLYIFIAPSIINIGGAEIYIRNKYLYLKNLGWDCAVISSKHGNVLIDDLKQFETLIFKELEFGPYLYSPERQDKLTKSLISKLPYVDSADKIIVESHSVNMSLWGELLSKKISAKHLAFLLEEKRSISPQQYAFLKFKHERGELAGITKHSLKLLFQPYEKLADDKSYYLLAHCSNSLEEIPNSKWDTIPTATYNIGSIGRLEKPFLQTVINDIREFVEEHPESTFNIFFIGGENGGKNITGQIYATFKNHKNVKVYITGFIYPIPLSLINKIDVFLSSAGSARVSGNAGKFTVAYDGNDLQPIGLFDYTTTNNLFREAEPIIPGKEWLTKILINKEFTPKRKAFTPFRPTFEAHMEFISKGNGHLSYYNFQKWKLNMKDKLRYMLIRIIGPDYLLRIINYKTRKLS